MFFAAGTTLISIALVAMLPETITEKPNALSLGFNDIFPIAEARRFITTPHVRYSLIMFVIYNIGFFLFIANFSLFAETQFGVSAEQVSFYMAWIGIVRVIIQTFFIARIQQALAEDRLLIAGIVAMLIAMVSLALTTEYWFVFVPLFFLSFGTGVSRPILMSTLTNSVIRTETATILGVNNSLSSVAQIIIPIVGGFIIQHLPSQTIPIASGVFFVSILWIIRNRAKLTS
jgi:DHA1 family tetracycline resistance protein-like MFS transporter